MASCQLQKPAEQTCNQKSHEHTFGQKITEMTHRVFKSCSEHIHHQGHQGQEAGHTVVACQTQCSGQTYAHHPDQGIPKAQTHCNGNNTHEAQAQSHCTGQSQGHHVKKQAAHNVDCHGKNEKSLKEKIAEKKNKVKGLFKKKNQEGGCEDKKSFSSSSSSSSDSESDNDAARKKY